MNKTMLKHLIGILSIIFINTPLIACDIHGSTGILPENNLEIPISQKGAGGLSEAAFNKIIDRIGDLYTEEFKNKGATLRFERRWTDAKVNASAARDTTGKVWSVIMFGGLARHPQMTEDGYAIVVCHEVGHHVGGLPKKTDPTAGSPWAANEGEADYFATLKCLRKYFAADNNTEIVKNMQIPNIVSSSCETSFANAEEIAICKRSSMASLALGELFRVVSKQTKAVNFDTPFNWNVGKTFDKHNAAQCRLDTFYAGSICERSPNENVSDTDENIGVCSTKNGDTQGVRPRCWFKPAELN